MGPRLTAAVERQLQQLLYKQPDDVARTKILLALKKYLNGITDKSTLKSLGLEFVTTYIPLIEQHEILFREQLDAWVNQEVKKLDTTQQHIFNGRYLKASLIQHKSRPELNVKEWWDNLPTWRQHQLNLLFENLTQDNEELALLINKQAMLILANTKTLFKFQEMNGLENARNYYLHLNYAHLKNIEQQNNQTLELLKTKAIKRSIKDESYYLVLAPLMAAYAFLYAMRTTRGHSLYAAAVSMCLTVFSLAFLTLTYALPKIVSSLIDLITWNKPAKAIFRLGAAVGAGVGGFYLGLLIVGALTGPWGLAIVLCVTLASLTIGVIASKQASRLATHLVTDAKSHVNTTNPQKYTLTLKEQTLLEYCGLDVDVAQQALEALYREKSLIKHGKAKGIQKDEKLILNKIKHASFIETRMRLEEINGAVNQTHKGDIDVVHAMGQTFGLRTQTTDSCSSAATLTQKLNSEYPDHQAPSYCPSYYPTPPSHQKHPGSIKLMPMPSARAA